MPTSCLLEGTLEEHEPLRMRQSAHALAPLSASLAAADDVARWKLVLTLLRRLGVPVVELENWETRGRPYSTNYRGLLDHHTATSASAPGDYPSWRIVSEGRSDLPGPLSQCGLGRSGSFWMIAAGYSNHAGSGGWRGLSGNYSVIGIECENNGVGEPWTAAQVRNLPIINAVICHVFGFEPEMVCRHAEWSTSGKIDTATAPLNSGDWIRWRTLEELPRVRLAAAGVSPDRTEEDEVTVVYDAPPERGSGVWIANPPFRKPIRTGDTWPTLEKHQLAKHIGVAPIGFHDDLIDIDGLLPVLKGLSDQHANLALQAGELAKAIVQEVRQAGAVEGSDPDAVAELLAQKLAERLSQ